MSAWWAAERGQATVELVALLPLLAAVVLAAAAVLAAGSAREAAGTAAEAGAVALLQDGDPAAAARRALGRDAIERATVKVEGRRVSVTVRPGLVPGPLARVLTATGTAHAGPGPAATTSTSHVRGGDGEHARPRGARDGGRP